MVDYGKWIGEYDNLESIGTMVKDPPFFLRLKDSEGVTKRFGLLEPPRDIHFKRLVERVFKEGILTHDKRFLKEHPDIVIYVDYIEDGSPSRSVYHYAPIQDEWIEVYYDENFDPQYQHRYVE